MSDLKKVYDILTKKNVSQIELINVEELLLVLRQNKQISLCSAILIPFYITECGTYELYFYELTINGLTEDDFKTYVLNKSDKQFIDDIDQSTLDVFEKCFIHLSDDESGQKLIDYLVYISTSVAVARDIEEVFGFFDRQNLYLDCFFN